MKSHISDIHEKIKPVVIGEKCSVCGKILTSKQRLNNHIAAVHEGEMSPSKLTETYAIVIFDPNKG